MITIAETQRLVEVMKIEFVTKEEFKTSFAQLERKLDILLNAVDKFTKRMEDQSQEIKILIHNMTTVQTWMRPVSSKTGVDYPF